MTVSRRLSLMVAVAVAYWVLVLCNPLQFAVADLLTPGANDNAASPYTMLERCEAVRLHIPTGHCS